MLLTKLLPALLMCFSGTQAAPVDDMSLPRGHVFSGALGESSKGLEVREINHVDCEYSGILPGIWVVGTCTTGSHYPDNAHAKIGGFCTVQTIGNPVGIICDIQWSGKVGDASQRPCTQPETSQFACLHDGDPCQLYHFAEDPNLGVAHCQVPATIIN